ncbi:MAG: M23 family metallopeptidase, partial [Chloroflexota bacterium]|nr:M23 family metallopeptidase [Chloroflexota bacterium]
MLLSGLDIQPLFATLAVLLDNCSSLFDCWDTLGAAAAAAVGAGAAAVFVGGLLLGPGDGTGVIEEGLPPIAAGTGATPPATVEGGGVATTVAQAPSMQPPVQSPPPIQTSPPLVQPTTPTPVQPAPPPTVQAGPPQPSTPVAEPPMPGPYAGAEPGLVTASGPSGQPPALEPAAAVEPGAAAPSTSPPAAPAAPASAEPAPVEPAAAPPSADAPPIAPPASSAPPSTSPGPSGPAPTDSTVAAPAATTEAAPPLVIDPALAAGLAAGVAPMAGALASVAGGRAGGSSSESGDADEEGEEDEVACPEAEASLFGLPDINTRHDCPGTRPGMPPNYAGLDFTSNDDYGRTRELPFEAGVTGEVTYVGGAFNTVQVTLENGNRIQFLHASQIFAQVGQHVEPTTVLGRTGGTGPYGPNHYEIHLHVQAFNEHGDLIDPDCALSGKENRRLRR